MSIIGYQPPLEGQIDMIGPAIEHAYFDYEAGQQCCNLFEGSAKHSLMPQPDGTAAHSLTLRAYKKALYTRSSVQKTLQLRFCHRYTEVPSTSISGNGVSVGHRHGLDRSDRSYLPLTPKCTPSSSSYRSLPGPADLGCFSGNHALVCLDTRYCMYSTIQTVLPVALLVGLQLG
jgi:hypothetical protein